MASVITEPCRGCKALSCIEVCPADCFIEGEDMLFINPLNCVCCQACIPECPSNAIFDEIEVPEKWSSYIQLNAEMAEKLPQILPKH